jgi:hypothetical protein
VALPPRIQKPGQPQGPQASGEGANGNGRREKEQLELDVKSVEEDLEELKARYDQYFLGVERKEPVRQRDELRKRVLRVKEAFTRNTGLKFRIQTLHARFLSYERMWLRSAREKEEGTYRRDLFKARLHRANREGAPEPAPEAPAAPPAQAPRPGAPASKPAAPQPVAAAAARQGTAQAAPPPGTPAPKPAAPRPAPAGGMNDAQLRKLYEQYVAAKRSCNEDVSRLSYDAVASTVSKQIPEIMTRFKAKSVEFKVEVKDGKAVLKAVPKV